jgi:hypothetical protein
MFAFASSIPPVTAVYVPADWLNVYVVATCASRFTVAIVAIRATPAAIRLLRVDCFFIFTDLDKIINPADRPAEQDYDKKILLPEKPAVWESGKYTRFHEIAIGEKC